MNVNLFFRRSISIASLVMAFSTLSGQGVQDTTYWTTNGQVSLNFSQVSLSNWVGGGKSSVSGIGNFDYNALYQKGRLEWDNTLKAGYGLMKESGDQVTKNEDKLELNSKLGLELNTEHLLYSSFVNFQTQFAPGYNYPNTTNKISDFLAPGYLTLATGLDYQPSESLSLFFTPVSAKFTIVADDSLSNAGAFGVDPGQTVMTEVGATFKGEYKATVMPNVDLSTSLTLFSNYFNNPENIDVNWDVSLNMKINDYLSANFSTNLVYDHDVLVPVDDQGNTGRRIQLKQVLGVGFSYKF
ncbi:MAG: DUF3078 domain-containing protein [Mariniphaga sp.]